MRFRYMFRHLNQPRYSKKGGIFQQLLRIENKQKVKSIRNTWSKHVFLYFFRRNAYHKCENNSSITVK